MYYDFWELLLFIGTPLFFLLLLALLLWIAIELRTIRKHLTEELDEENENENDVPTATKNNSQY